MTERIGGREAIRFKFASVVGVRHHGCAKGTGSPERLFAPGLLLERLHLVRAPRGDGKESPRPCGQGGVAPPLPAAQHECLTPVLVCTAVCDSEAFLRIVAMELARLRDTLVQLLAEAALARASSEPRVLRKSAARNWRARWTTMRVVAVQDCFGHLLISFSA